MQINNFILHLILFFALRPRATCQSEGKKIFMPTKGVKWT